MVAISMFWAALAAGIFFLLGAAFKVIIAVFNALFSVLGDVAVLLIKIIIVLFFLVLARGIASAYGTDQFWPMIGIVVLDLAVLRIFFFLYAMIGYFILQPLIWLMESIMDAITFIFECAEDACDIIYIKSIRAIVNRLEKC